MRAWLYDLRLPPYFFNSVVKAGGFLRWWANRAAMAHGIATRDAAERCDGCARGERVTDELLDRRVAGDLGVALHPRHELLVEHVRVDRGDGFAVMLRGVLDDLVRDDRVALAGDDVLEAIAVEVGEFQRTLPRERSRIMVPRTMSV